MTEDQIKAMVDRFLMWKLPESFNPDGGISFKADFNENTAHPMKHRPVGTNLFDAVQATAMVRHMIEGLAANPGDFWGSPGHERDRMLAQIRTLVEALERIAYIRPSRVHPSNMIEQMERIALDAIARVKP